ncbi:CLUMA_CG000159, isoform A [Clunio marinus]|uniref:Beta-1,4-N-acetylgalactosaminyltransferase n=1 Tax=Clunio marinus TaxID=568069 RepID=A0A1J1HJA3_9DIPT|nr:CLUMA_CG000159, isoform A [Clunio marinus]
MHLRLQIQKFNYVKIGYLLLFVYLCWPSRFAMIYYENIPGNEIYDNLIRKISRNLSQFNQGIQCDYTELLEENHYFYKKFTTDDIINKIEIKSGGEFWPEECTPSFSTAIIVPYRKREEQLKQFINYIHNFLRKQQIHYKIFVIEQGDDKPFNRAKLFNIGSRYALKENFPCLVMQDIDLMPLNLGNIYACTKRPRHMSSSLDTFRFNLPYYGLVGGAIAIATEDFVNINGFSNVFQGWGGEDDDLYKRLLNKNYRIIRFHPSYAQYTMLKHTRERRNPKRNEYLKNSYLRFDIDGLNSLVFSEIEIHKNTFFTHILVQT